MTVVSSVTYLTEERRQDILEEELQQGKGGIMPGYTKEGVERNFLGKEVTINVSGQKIVGRITSSAEDDQPFYCLSVTTPTGAVVSVDVADISQVKRK